MKLRLILIILFFVSYHSQGQERLLNILPLVDGRVTYTGVIQVDSSGKDELYDRAMRWFITTYLSPKDVIDLEDRENREIIGKGSLKIVYYFRDPYIDYTISIIAKDNRFKYTITDLSYSENSHSIFNIEDFPKSWFGQEKLYLTVDKAFNSLVNDLEKYMKTKPKDDW